LKVKEKLYTFSLHFWTVSLIFTLDYNCLGI
jgi:hypothetical protein